MANIVNKVKKQSILKAFAARTSKCARAAFFLVLAFLVVGLCTIGSAASPRKVFHAMPDTSVVFYLAYDGSGLDEIWLNVGSVYAEAGADTDITLRYSSTGSSADSISWLRSRLGDYAFGNVYSASGNGFSGANYNWVRVADLENEEENTKALSTSYHLIELKAGCEMLINEIVFVDVQGEIIPAYVTEAQVKEHVSDYDRKSGWGDAFSNNPAGAEALTDAPHSLRRGSSAWTNFTESEIYSLVQIDNILLGGQVYEDSVYLIDADNGPLSALLMLPGVAVFGRTPFGLRLMPLLFTAALVALAYFFGKELFGSDGFGFLFAGLFAAGGLALTVGRLGLSFPMTAFFVVLSYFLMYKFWQGGISSERPVYTALSVLVSGIAFAFAFAVDPKSVIAGAGVLVLFVLGAVRHHKEYAAACRRLRQEMSEQNAADIPEEEMRANLERYERESASLAGSTAYKNRLIYLFFFVSFIVGTILVTLLSSLASYFSYVRFYEADPENPVLGIFNLIFRALGDAFTVSNLTSYTAANASNAFGWLIGLKGATLLSASEGGRYLALNAQLNPALMLTAAVGFLFMTVYAVLYSATGGREGAYATKYSGRILRAYLALLLGMLTSVLSVAFSPNVSAAYSLLFSVFYIGFIPLTFYTAYVHDGSAKKKVLGIQMNKTARVIFALLIVYAVVFILMLPMTFCFPTFTEAARYCFGWTTFVNNGFYRL